MNIKPHNALILKMSSDSIKAKYEFGYTDGRYDLMNNIVKSCMTGIIGGLLISISISIFRSVAIMKVE
jgi:hypothetical protein